MIICILNKKGHGKTAHQIREKITGKASGFDCKSKIQNVASFVLAIYVRMYVAM